MDSSRNSHRVAVLVAAVFLFTAATSNAEPPQEKALGNGRTFEFQIVPTAESNFLLALFRLWLPNPELPVKGIIAVLPGSDAHGTPMADDPHWQALAARWNYALLGVTLTTRTGAAPYYQAEKGSGQALLSALDEIAAASGHVELKQAPIAIIGHSQGGQFAFHFTCWKPERVVAFATIKGGYYDARPSAEARSVPGLLFIGENDAEFRRMNIRKLFTENAGPKTRWCLAIEPDAGHELGRCPDLFIPFFEAVIKKNLDPLQSDLSTLEMALADPQKAPTKVWLPNPRVSEVWKGFVRGMLADSTSDFNIPIAPPPKAAELSPGSHDFGEIKSGQATKAATFAVRPLTNRPAWDSIRASCLGNRFSASAERTGDQWEITVRPNVPERPSLGRLHDIFLVQLFQDNILVPGGLTGTLTISHVDEAISVSPRHFYFGVHSGPVQRSVRITSHQGPLIIRSVELSEGQAVEVAIKKLGETSSILTATFAPLKEEGAHSGTLTVLLDKPRSVSLILPFIGHYKP